MLKRLLLCFVLLSSLADYGYRAYETVSKGGLSDFQDPYVGSVLWLKGQNPYNPKLVQSTWHERTGEPVFNEVKTVYPLTAYFLLMPFALVSYKVSVALWLTLLLFSVFATAWLIWKQNWSNLSLFATAALVSAYGPYHTALHGANCVPLVLWLVLTATCLGNQWSAGACLAVAICIKPQIAVWFILYFLVKRRFRPILSCVITGTLLSLLSFLPYINLLPELFRDYRTEYSRGFENGRSGDYTQDKSDRLSMVNLQPALFQITHNRSASNFAALTAFLFLITLWFRSSTHSRDELLILAALFAISVLPFYRRTNDLGLLSLGLLLAFRRNRHLGVAFAAGCAALFYLPINSVLARFSVYGVLSGLQSWLVLAIAALLVWELYRSAPQKLASTGDDVKLTEGESAMT